MTLDPSVAEKEQGPCLMVVYGPLEERIGARLHLLDDELMVIGRRHPPFGIQGIGDSRISSNHFEVCLHARDLEVRDLKSKNGLLFDGRRLAHAHLQDGQVFQVGSTFLAFRREMLLQRLPPQGPGRLIGAGPAITRVRDQAALLARQDRPISVSGPVGSEKELLAQELHRLAGRGGEFVVRDFSSVPANRQEAELFGDQGAWGAAVDGTVFVQDIERLSPDLQERFCDKIEDRKGSDPHVVVAFLPDMQERVSRGDMSERLFGLLSLAQIELPSLRDRPEDLGALAIYCLGRSGYEHLGFSARLMWAILRNPWPGELRALERILNTQAMSAPRGSEFLDLNPSTEAYLEHQSRIYAPHKQDDSTVDIHATR